MQGRMINESSHESSLLTAIPVGKDCYIDTGRSGIGELIRWEKGTFWKRNKTMTDSKDTINDMEFVVALKNFINVQSAYIDLIGLPGVRVEFVLKNVFSPLARRIKAGERSKKLYKELMALEA
jgi:hypothetical protein